MRPVICRSVFYGTRRDTLRSRAQECRQSGLGLCSLWFCRKAESFPCRSSPGCPKYSFPQESSPTLGETARSAEVCFDISSFISIQSCSPNCSSLAKAARN